MRRIFIATLVFLILMAIGLSLSAQDWRGRSRVAADNSGLSQRVAILESLVDDLRIELDAEKVKVVQLKSGQLNTTEWIYSQVNANKIEVAAYPTGRLIKICDTGEPTGEREVSKDAYDTLAAANMLAMEAQMTWLQQP